MRLRVRLEVLPRLPAVVGRERQGLEHKEQVGDRFVSIDIDQELGGQGATFILADGTRGDLAADFVLYFCDPTYDWSPINQLKRVLREKLDASDLSVRVLADALRTSPSQVVRLLEENRGSKQLLQLLKLADLAGYRVTFTLKRKPAA